MTIYKESDEAIVQLQNKIGALVSAADPSGEIAQVLERYDIRIYEERVGAELLLCRLTEALAAAQGAAAAAYQKAFTHIEGENQGVRKLMNHALDITVRALHSVDVDLAYAANDYPDALIVPAIYNAATTAKRSANAALAIARKGYVEEIGSTSILGSLSDATVH
jgi:hypothetical protein